jgi:type I restriction enzyme S subunit
MTGVAELIGTLMPPQVQYRTLGSVLRIKNGKDHKALGEGAIPVYGSGGIMRYADEAAAEGPSVLIPRKGSLGNLFYVEGPFWVVDTIFRTEIDSSLIEPKFLYYQLLTMGLGDMNQAGGVPSQTQSVLNLLRIPVPPLETQREIVRILDQFTKLEAELESELKARRRQYEYYQRSLLSFSEDEAAWMTLGDIGKVLMCKRVFKHETSAIGDIPFFKIGTFGGEPDAYIAESLFEDYKSRYSFPKKGDVLISAAGTIGRVFSYDGSPAYFQDSNIVWVDNDETMVLNSYLIHWYRVIDWATDGATIRRLYNDNIRRAEIAVPSIEDQRRIVGTLDKFDALVNDLSIGLPAELTARRKQYEHYRDRLLTFKEAAA